MLVHQSSGTHTETRCSCQKLPNYVGRGPLLLPALLLLTSLPSNQNILSVPGHTMQPSLHLGDPMHTHGKHAHVLMTCTMYAQACQKRAACVYDLVQKAAVSTRKAKEARSHQHSNQPPLTAAMARVGSLTSYLNTKRVAARLNKRRQHHRPGSQGAPWHSASVENCCREPPHTAAPRNLYVEGSLNKLPQHCGAVGLKHQPNPSIINTHHQQESERRKKNMIMSHTHVHIL